MISKQVRNPCPECGAPLEKKVVFKEAIIQCSKCEYKQAMTPIEEILYDKILEESR